MSDDEAFVSWKPIFATGVASIDQEHRQFLEIMNDLHLAVLLGEPGGATLEKLSDYGAWHFRQEEALMESAGFPGLADHREEHAAFLRRLDALRAEGSCSVGTLAFMSEWVVRHILGADREFGYWSTAANEPPPLEPLVEPPFARAVLDC